MKKRWLIIPIVTFLHLLATGSFLNLALTASYRWIDTGAPPTLDEQVVKSITDVLCFPVTNVFDHIAWTTLGPFGNVVFIANSLLWAVCAYLLFEVFWVLGTPES